MKYAWLEAMVEEGQIRKEAADAIYADCANLRKEALVKEAQQGDAAQKALDMGAALVVAPAIAAIINKIVNKVESGSQLSALKESMRNSHQAVVAANKSEKELASKRFQELAQIAPLVAANQNVAQRLVSRSMKDGFSDEDVSKLMMIQASLTPEQFGKMQLLTPKTASAQQDTVSMSAIGSIAADSYLMIKSAGIKDSKGFKFLSEYMPAAATLALGTLAASAVAGGVNSLKAHIEDKKMKKKLEDSFTSAMKASDPDREPLHANKVQAREAFEALAHFAPHVALQPQAARSFMNKIVAYNQQMNVQDIKDLAEIQRNVTQSTRPNPFFEGLTGSAQALGLDKSLAGLQQQVGRDYGTTMMKELGMHHERNSKNQ